MTEQPRKHFTDDEWEMIEDSATIYGADKYLVGAIILKESGGYWEENKHPVEAIFGDWKLAPYVGLFDTQVGTDLFRRMDGDQFLQICALAQYMTRLNESPDRFILRWYAGMVGSDELSREYLESVLWLKHMLKEEYGD